MSLDVTILVMVTLGTVLVLDDTFKIRQALQRIEDKLAEPKLDATKEGE